jgi:aminopeptidase-like protein
MIINSILSAVKSVYSGSSAKRLTKGLYEFNRLISFDAYEKGARYCVKMLKEVGAEKVELHSFLSDGKKMYGNWRSPEVWCIKSGYLELKLSNKWVRFADYPKIPTSVFTYAAPTNGIIETELVSLSTASLEGKLCFCDPTEENINTLIKGKATGIATDFAPNWENVREPEDFRNGHRWDNSSLFEFTKERLAGFSLKRNQGKKIRALLDSGKSIPCRFKISGKLGSGKIYAVSAIIKGKTNPKEEAVCVAHLYEAGANDNASGVAGSIEGIRTLVSLIKKR